MKTIFKLVSMFILMLSGTAFAQTDCIKLPPALDKLIKGPIQDDRYDKTLGTLDEVTMNDYLVNYHDALLLYSTKDEFPTELLPYVDKAKLTNFHKKATTMVEEVTSLTELKNNILLELKSSNDIKEVEALILWNYQIQILENSGLETNSISAEGKLSPRWKCALSIIAGAGMGALEGAGSGAIGGPYGAAAGAVLGGIFGGMAGAAAGC